MTAPFLHPFASPSRTDWVRIVRGEGAHVFDETGKRYIDAFASLWYCNVGHGRTEIADAVAAQMSTLAAFHCFAMFTNDPAEQLAAEVVKRSPMPDGRAFLCCSGSEAVDTAIKFARKHQLLTGHPERTLVVTVSDAYHGVNYGGTAAQGIAANRDGWGELVPGFINIKRHDTAALDAVFAEHGGSIAAFLVEPMIGAGGIYPPPDGWLPRVRELCTEHGALYISDEVTCGFGRLGTWFGCQRFDVTPDLITFAKGVTSGYQPLGGCIVSREVAAAMEAPGYVLRHGYTYSGHPSACAAALVNLRILEEDGLIERGQRAGERLREGLRGLLADGLVTEVRGLGGVAAVGLPAGVDAVALRAAMIPDGVIARPVGGGIGYCLPFVIADEDVDTIVSVLRDHLSD